MFQIIIATRSTMRHQDIDLTLVDPQANVCLGCISKRAVYLPLPHKYEPTRVTLLKDTAKDEYLAGVIAMLREMMDKKYPAGGGAEPANKRVVAQRARRALKDAGLDIPVMREVRKRIVP